jgi:hypothetical protein
VINTFTLYVREFLKYGFDFDGLDQLEPAGFNVAYGFFDLGIAGNVGLTGIAIWCRLANCDISIFSCFPGLRHFKQKQLVPVFKCSGQVVF